VVAGVLAFTIGLHVSAAALAITPKLSTRATGDGMPTLCAAVAQRIASLPASTRLEDWPKLLKMPGLTRPIWEKENAANNISLIKRFYSSAGSPLLTDDKDDSLFWSHVEKRVLSEVKSGTVRLESAHVNLSGSEADTKLWRLSAPIRSSGTLRGPKIFGSVLLAWSYMIAESEEKPNLRNVPLFPYYTDMDLFYFRNKLYFAILPDGELRQFTFVPQFDIPADMLVCDFDLRVRERR
jgi:hypothetical protein